MKKILSVAAFQLLGMAMLNAQEIKGFVRDEEGSAVSNATVSLLKAKDSSVLKLELSKEGRFAFQKIAGDSLIVSISYVGHQPFTSSPFLFDGSSLELPAYTLTAKKEKMQNVVVTARKKLLDVKADRTILNVEGTINAAGSDALELLRKSPGVTVDNDERLSVNGKNGVQVYVDNKPSPLNGKDLSDYLKSLSSAQIEAIEVIHNPGAMYEASGSAGIINIRLKKNKIAGFNASITAGVSASRHWRWEDGVSLNYRNQKLNAFASYNNSYGKMEMEMDLNRVVKDTAFYQKSNMLSNKNNHVFKTGLDYTLSKKSNIGILMNGSINSPEADLATNTPIVHYPTGTVAKMMLSENITNQKNKNINSNINYQYKGSKGRSLLVNADYGYYNNKQEQVQPNSFWDATGKNELYRRNYRIISPTTIDIYSLKADYEQEFAKGKLAAGAKSGLVKTNNIFNQYSESGNAWQLDKRNSNVYDYRENVNAAYLQYSRTLGAISLQAGLRAEQANVEAKLEGYANDDSEQPERLSSFQKGYLDFFPSFNINYSAGADNKFALAYSRRIDRPVYQDLNPFEYRVNEYTYHKGSTDLRPQYTNTVSMTHTFRYKLNTTLSYSHVKDVFGQLVDTAQGMKGYLVNSNIASQDITNLNISYPFQWKNFSLFTNVNTYYSKYQSDYGSGRNLDLDVWAVNIFAQNSYRFANGWSAELSGFYSSPTIWQGTMRTGSIWSADAGVQKQILKGNGTIKASVSDVFNSLKWSARSDFAGQKVDVAGNYESRQLRLNFSYRFGNKNIKASRQYKTGLEEEINRMQSSGGLGHQ